MFCNCLKCKEKVTVRFLDETYEDVEEFYPKVLGISVDDYIKAGKEEKYYGEPEE